MGHRSLATADLVDGPWNPHFFNLMPQISTGSLETCTEERELSNLQE